MVKLLLLFISCKLMSFVLCLQLNFFQILTCFEDPARSAVLPLAHIFFMFCSTSYKPWMVLLTVYQLYVESAILYALFLTYWIFSLPPAAFTLLSLLVTWSKSESSGFFSLYVLAEIFLCKIF